jgi:hypothetical protein
MVTDFTGIYALASSLGIEAGLFLPDNIQLIGMDYYYTDEDGKETNDPSWRGGTEDEPNSYDENDTEKVNYKVYYEMKQLKKSIATIIFEMELTDDNGNIITNNIETDYYCGYEEKQPDGTYIVRNEVHYYIPINHDILMSDYIYVNTADGSYELSYGASFDNTNELRIFVPNIDTLHVGDTLIDTFIVQAEDTTVKTTYTVIITITESSYLNFDVDTSNNTRFNITFNGTSTNVTSTSKEIYPSINVVTDVAATSKVVGYNGVIRLTLSTFNMMNKLNMTKNIKVYQASSDATDKEYNSLTFKKLSLNTDYVLNIKNNPYTLNKVDGVHTIYLLDSNKSYYGLVNGVAHIGNMSVFSNNDCDAKIEFNSGTGAKYIVLSISARPSDGSDKSITESDIKDIIITLEKVSGITLPENSELVIDKRYSGSSNEIINSKKPGVFSVIIPIEDADGISEFKLKMENLPIPITKTWESSLSLDNQTIYLLDENKIDARNVEGILASAGIRTIIGELPDDMVTDNGTSAEIKFIPAEDRKYIALTIRVNETGTAITENDIGNIIITLEKNDNDNAFDKDSAELNVRLNSSGETTALTGYVVSNYIPVSLSENTVTKLTIQGATLDDSNASIVYCHSNYAPIYATMAGNYGASIKRNGTAVYKDENNNDYIKVGYVNTRDGDDSTSAYDTALNGTAYIRLCFKLSNSTVTMNDLDNVVITLEKEQLVISENSIVNIPGIVYNQRLSQSSGGMSSSSATGMFTFILSVEPGAKYCLSFDGLPLPLNKSVSGTSNHVLYGLKVQNPTSSGDIHTLVGANSNIKDMGSAATENSVTFTTSKSTPTNYIAVSIAVTNGGTISASDVEHITYELEKI